jgi:hypothetical protein
MGDKVTLNPHTGALSLHKLVGETFGMAPDTYEVFFRGEPLPKTEDPICKLNIKTGSIIHILEKNKPEEENMEVKVFCQEMMYTYRTPKNALISSLKDQLVKIT